MFDISETPVAYVGNGFMPMNWVWVATSPHTLPPPSSANASGFHQMQSVFVLFATLCVFTQFVYPEAGDSTAPSGLSLATVFNPRAPCRALFVHAFPPASNAIASG